MPDVPPGRRRASRQVAIARNALRLGLVLALGGWAVAAAVPGMRAEPGVRLARDVLDHHVFAPEVIAEARRALSGQTGAGARWAYAVLTLHAFEMASRQDGADVAAQAPRPGAATPAPDVETVARAIETALERTPGDGFLWFALFALRFGDDQRIDAERLAWLERSYRHAPWEGWVAIRRAAALMPRRDLLPPHLAAKVEAEFDVLLRQQVMPALQAVFAAADAPLRLSILKRIDQLPDMQRGASLRVIARELEGRAQP